MDGMMDRDFGRIVNITSSAVRVPIPVIGLSNAARAALTNFVLGLVPSGIQQRRHDQQHSAWPVRHQPAPKIE